MSNVSIFRSSNPAGQTERELGTQGEKTKFPPELPGADLELEAEIVMYSDMCAAAQTPGEARMAWDWLKQAHERRSPVIVAEMEKSQGIA